jgi:hypothetical protein
MVYKFNDIMVPVLLIFDPAAYDITSAIYAATVSV